jgi:hypothetical protein
MWKAVKTAFWIMVALFVLSIALGGDGNPLDRLTWWLAEPTSASGQTRFEDLFLIALLLVAIGFGVRFFKKEAKAAFGKGGGGGKAH